MEKYSLLIKLLLIIGAVFIVSTAHSQTPFFTDATQTLLATSGAAGQGMDGVSADIDGDGDLDIIIAREYSRNVILINNGKGSYTDGTSGRIPFKNLDSEDIAVVDLDGDGDIDIVFATEDHAQHEMYLNQGNGFFTDVSSRLPSSIANSVLALDVNNDGKSDLIFGNAGAQDTPAMNFILINNGNATFTNETPARLLTTPDITQDIKAADIDGDGDNDLIFGNEDGNKVLINNHGIFTDETLNRLPLTGTEETRKVTLADVDNDGDIDIFFSNVGFRYPVRQDRLLLNDGHGVFTDATSTSLPIDTEHTMDAVFIDADKDGDLDLVTANIFNNRPVKGFLNDGKGVFTEATEMFFKSEILAEGIGIDTGDYNGDGVTDLYVINRRTPGQTLTDRILLGYNPNTGINGSHGEVPQGYQLLQNYPNPFNPATVIGYSLPATGSVILKVYDIGGKEISTLVNTRLSAGNYEVSFDASGMASGVYYYTLQADGFTETKKMLLIK